MLTTRQSHRWRASLTALLTATVLGAGMIAQAPAAAQARTTETQFSAFRPATCGTYSVRPGDWLSVIASRFGLSWQYLAGVNNIANPNLIFPGQQIALCPTKAAVVSAPAPTAAAAPTAATTPAHATVAAKVTQQAPVKTTTVKPQVVTHYTAPTRPATTHVSAAPAKAGTLSSVNWGGEPCRSGAFANGPLSAWKIPPGCYGGVYSINPANYVARGGFGQCSWWPQVLHPNDPGILQHAHSSVPAAGAVVFFAPGVQGAGGSGHYGEVVAVLGGGWLLISEMNDTWRGAGWGRVNYRYVRQGPGVSFIYG